MLKKARASRRISLVTSSVSLDSHEIPWKVQWELIIIIDVTANYKNSKLGWTDTKFFQVNPAVWTRSFSLLKYADWFLGLKVILKWFFFRQELSKKSNSDFKVQRFGWHFTLDVNYPSIPANTRLQQKQYILGAAWLMSHGEQTLSNDPPSPQIRSQTTFIMTN